MRDYWRNMGRLININRKPINAIAIRHNRPAAPVTDITIAPVTDITLGAANERRSGTPVVVVCYNRPDHLSRVLDRLHACRVDNLYIVSDAARTTKDATAVAEVRRIITNITWTQPRIKLLGGNHGCGKSIPLAVSWVLQENDVVIVLEDDCVPRPHFMQYMNSCLDKYKDNARVFGVAAWGLSITSSIKEKYQYDAYFHPIMGSEGWATWKRAWVHYEPDLRRLYERVISEKVNLCQAGKDFTPGILRKLKDPTYDVWSLNWVLTCFLNKAYYVYPIVAQIDNIGCDGSGLHCSVTSYFPVDNEEKKVERLPGNVILNPAIINYYAHFYQTGMVKSSKSKILAYHRIMDATFDPCLLSVSPQNFEEHLKTISGEFEVVRLRNFVNDIKNGCVRNDQIAVAFDDGYLDNLTNALPLLEKYGVPATVFITAGMMDSKVGFYWDTMEQLVISGKIPLEDYKRIQVELRGLTFDEINARVASLFSQFSMTPVFMEDRELLGLEQLRLLSGHPLIDIGNHTMHHEMLTNAGLSLESSILAAGSLINRITGGLADLFCYPFGCFNDETKRFLSSNGYVAAVTTRRGEVHNNSDPFELPRYQIRNWPSAKFIKEIVSD